MARAPGPLLAALTAVSVLLLMLIQALVVLLAFSNVQNSAAPTAFVAIDNYWALLRSFEFRRTLANTCWVLVLALALVVPAAGAGWRLMQRPSWWRCLLAIALLAPLALPGATGVLAWRSMLNVLHLSLDRPWIALPVFAVVLAWRALPLAVAMHSVRPAMRRGSRLGLVSAVATYWTLADVSVVMLLTGGAPHNATHVLASWSYVTAVTDGQIGLAAAMATVLLATLWLVSVAMGWLGLLPRSPCRVHGGDPASQVRAHELDAPAARRLGDWLALTALLLWLFAPVAVVLAQAGWPWQWGQVLRHLVLESDYIGWWGNILLLVVAAGLTARWLAPPMASWLAECANRTHCVAGFGLPVLALTSLPVAYVPLLWLETRLWSPVGLLGLGLLYVAILLCLGVGLATRGQHPNNDRKARTGLALAALFFVTQEFTNALALNTGPRQTLNTGMVNQLAFRVDVPSATTALAIVLAFLLFGTLYGALVWLVQR